MGNILLVALLHTEIIPYLLPNNLHNQIFPLTEIELQMHFVVNIWIGHVSVRRTAEYLLR